MQNKQKSSRLIAFLLILVYIVVSVLSLCLRAQVVNSDIFSDLLPDNIRNLVFYSGLIKTLLFGVIILLISWGVLTGKKIARLAFIGLVGFFVFSLWLNYFFLGYGSPFSGIHPDQFYLDIILVFFGVYGASIIRSQVDFLKKDYMIIVGLFLSIATT